MPSVLGVPDDWMGDQQPRVSLIPSYVSSAGDEAIDLAAMAGLILDPWQELVLRGSLGEAASGKWSAFECGLVVSRQNGKNVLLEARELAELFLVADLAGPRTIIHSAHLFSTSLEHFRRLSFRIKETPELARKVKHKGSRMVGIRESHGEESIELEDGSRIMFAARTRGGRRGFTIDLLVWDEAMELPDAVIGAVMPTVSARTGPEFLPGPQVWYTGSAVNQETMPHGLQLARVRERGHAGEDGSLAYFEWSAPEDADPADPAAQAQANPAFGGRITAEYVSAERAAMPAIEFANERLGIGNWPDTSPNPGRVIPSESWASCAELDESNRISSVLTFCVDVNPDQTWGAIGVGGHRDDGLVQIAVVAHERGTGWIVDQCAELAKQHRRARFVVDKRGPAADLIADLIDSGLNVLEASTEDYRNACGGFFNAVVDRKLRYPSPQPELDDALAGARKAPLGDGWKWSRKDSSSPDISPLVAVTFAYWFAATRKPRKPRVINLAEALANA